MRKEVLLAIFFGFAIGLVITFGIYTANRGLRKNQTENEFIIEAEPDVTISPKPQAQALTIYEPVNEALVDQETIKLRGKTFANGVVAVAVEEVEYLITADDQGLFSLEIELIGGLNTINITSVSSDGEEVETSLSLVYSTAEIE